MATFYRRGGKRNKSGTWYVQYFDDNGRRRTKRGCTDKEATLQIARKIEADVALRKAGVCDPKTDRYAQEGRKPTIEHLEDFRQDMLSRGVTDVLRRIQLTIFAGSTRRLIGGMTVGRCRMINYVA